MPSSGSLSCGQLDSDQRDEFILSAWRMYVGDADRYGTYRWKDVGPGSGIYALPEDVNKDGLNDIVSFGTKQVWVYLNKGDLVFEPPIQSLLPLPDGVSMYSFPFDHVFKWNNSSTFECVTTSYEPILVTIDRAGRASLVRIPASRRVTEPPVIGDFDSDGISDVLVSSADEPPVVYFYRSPAPGVVGEPLQITSPLPARVSGALKAQGVEDRILLNDGSACSWSRSAFSCFSVGMKRDSSYGALDIDRDGTTDIVSGFIYGFRIFFGNRGSFSRPKPTVLPGFWNFLTIGNFDDDDAPDAAGEADQTLILSYQDPETKTFPTGITYEPSQTVRVGNGCYSGSTASELTKVFDVNGDGHVDLVTPGWIWFEVRYGDGCGNFGQPVVMAFPPDITAYYAVPIQGGTTIRYLAKSSNTTMAVLDQDLKVIQQVPVPTAFADLFAADADGDGLTDVFLYSSAGAYAFVVRQMPDHTFVASPPTTIENDHSFQLADIDGDRRLEIITLRPWRGELLVLSGPGDGTFPNVMSLTIPTANWVVPADIDGDGRSEILVSADRMYVVRLTADGLRLDPYTALPLNPQPIATDLDGDGRTDLVYGKRNYRSALQSFAYYLNTAKGWTAASTITIPSFGRLSFIDVNHDKRPDLINADELTIQVILNGNPSPAPIRTRGVRRQ